MAIEKKVANSVLSKIDSVAETLTKLSASGAVPKDATAALIRNMDAYADKFHIAAFGEKSLKNYQAKVSKVIQRESDEPYMDTFKNPQKPIQTDADEPYMHETGKSFNGKSVKTYDSDDTSQVSDRPEYDVRDLNDMAGGTKKQPTWPGGSAGQSTRQGARKPSAAKTWAR